MQKNLETFKYGHSLALDWTFVKTKICSAFSFSENVKYSYPSKTAKKVHQLIITVETEVGLCGLCKPFSKKIELSLLKTYWVVVSSVVQFSWYCKLGDYRHLDLFCNFKLILRYFYPNEYRTKKLNKNCKKCPKWKTFSRKNC